LTDECASLTLREETTSRGITEARETIEALGETFDDLNEQVLRLDLKLNQAASEKTRLEIEL
jgi:hypothetical protein